MKIEANAIRRNLLRQKQEGEDGITQAFNRGLDVALTITHILETGERFSADLKEYNGKVGQK